jgi:uncharacterized protein (UPF0261 family)
LDVCDLGAAKVSCVNAHINDAAFASHALTVFDEWLAQGLISKVRS